MHIVHDLWQINSQQSSIFHNNLSVNDAGDNICPPRCIDELGVRIVKGRQVGLVHGGVLVLHERGPLVRRIGSIAAGS